MKRNFWFEGDCLLMEGGDKTLNPFRPSPASLVFRKSDRGRGRGGALQKTPVADMPDLDPRSTRVSDGLLVAREGSRAGPPADTTFQ